jgi:NAD(P)H-hydrate epimerase
MQDIDQITIEKFGISDELLMENAGFEFVNRFIQDFCLQKNDGVAVLCGGGNNGGDGFVIARHLCRRGYRTAVFLFVSVSKLKGVARRNFDLLSIFGIEVFDLSDEEKFEKRRNMLYGFSYYVDALLGTGFKGTPRGMIKRAIGFANELRGSVVSIDIPSGVDADGGQKDLFAVHACATYTVGCLKYGLIDYPGKEAAGRVEVLDIGFPRDAVKQVANPAILIDSVLVNSLFPVRKQDSHKGTYGHLAVMGGRRGYEGASLLASRAALRTGSGLVTIFLSSESSIQKPDEVIAKYLPDELEDIPDDILLDKLFERQNAIVVGPGLGVSPAARRLLVKVLQLERKVVIDADGLNCISNDPEILKGHRCDLVLTPHIGEMTRLMGMDKEQVKGNKRSVARDLAMRYGLTLVLKDAVTVVATSSGNLFINNGGIAALSKGGSGDVLSGIIGSLMARGLTGENAAVFGVYLHTECGRTAQMRGSADSVQAGDLIMMLPEVFSQLQCGCPMGNQSQGTQHG